MEDKNTIGLITKSFEKFFFHIILWSMVYIQYQRNTPCTIPVKKPTPKFSPISAEIIPKLLVESIHLYVKLQVMKEGVANVDA